MQRGEQLPGAAKGRGTTHAVEELAWDGVLERRAPPRQRVAGARVPPVLVELVVELGLPRQVVAVRLVGVHRAQLQLQLLLRLLLLRQHRDPDDQRQHHLCRHVAARRAGFAGCGLLCPPKQTDAQQAEPRPKGESNPGVTHQRLLQARRGRGGPADNAARAELAAHGAGAHPTAPSPGEAEAPGRGGRGPAAGTGPLPVSAEPPGGGAEGTSVLLGRARD